MKTKAKGRHEGESAVKGLLPFRILNIIYIIHIYGASKPKLFKAVKLKSLSIKLFYLKTAVACGSDAILLLFSI